MATVISIDNLNNEIKNALEAYNKEVVTSLKRETTKAMDDLVKETKATAPVGKRKKHYKSNITSKTLSESQYGISKLWYVKGPDYRLSHLLNNGHALRNGGRYEGTNFIGKATDKIVEAYTKAIEEAIKK